MESNRPKPPREGNDPRARPLFRTTLRPYNWNLHYARTLEDVPTSIFRPRLPANRTHEPSPRRTLLSQALLSLVGVQESSQTPLKTQAASPDMSVGGTYRSSPPFPAHPEFRPRSSTRTAPTIRPRFGHPELASTCLLWRTSRMTARPQSRR